MYNHTHIGSACLLHRFFLVVMFYLKGYALCRRPPLSGRGLCGGGYVVLAHLLCWVCQLLVVLSVLAFLWNVRKQVVFWRSFFMVFPLVAVTWDTIFIILGVQNLSFDKPGASIFLPWGLFCQLGDTREDHGRTHGAQNQILVILADFSWFGEPVLRVFWAPIG